MKLFVLMVVRNRAELTCACLSYIRAQTYSNYEVVVVDDGSTDGTADKICEQFPDVHVIIGNGNLWWSAGMNKGLEYILQKATDEDYVLTLNDDTYFEPTYFERLVDASRKNPESCVGSLLINYFDKTVIEDSGMKIEWDGYTYKLIPFSEPNEMVKVDTLSCRGALIPISVFKKIGYFNDKCLPHYIADYEFFVRAARRGVSLIMSYKAVIYNKDNQSRAVCEYSLFWRMFNRKSSSNILNHYYMIIHCSPSMYFVCKNMVVYTYRSVMKVVFKKYED